MATYAIGDIQGCLDELKQLLDTIHFDPENDQLWFAGDLVNRGPHSLETLQFIRALGKRAITVLGNHDLHLLALAEGDKRYSSKFDTLLPILQSEQRGELLDWLRHRPLLHHNSKLGYTLVHAGLPPQWSLQQAQARAKELEATLQGDHYRDFLKVMYGNKPKKWSDQLSGTDRLRFITNCFTRLRFCTPDGKLDLNNKGKVGSQSSDDLLPWFQVPHRASRSQRILFGHWSTLQVRSEEQVYALDTGCLWGGELSALRIDCDPPTWHTINCQGALQPR
ncbi:MAG TPA: symmetrical bis(5'-nucleosyl)-tetraphosphatase [Gammaproteobacteria bacterium]|jgi:bis(5'-nucleosyl)-tetraphosphatase (symmetrical)|nr:symmetrical bis(5'-nucleosyl)-tetraphosphatase [Gammaproteobacteria bacterium]MBT3718189.1 symmetrical bis(5'-nucleosyl)-tetraphosphatase [Gammaproteobacteria bacterium]MBT3843587.1 symmetrical bis(5'-nucleosyl)-tetraphosphatase [Gammaproteobacteria bacterium]MBT3893057.1 symmetrical bis(5'-nucleosyl)-tetraphosphatase [Gammaproteobacteria bacterium]MBT5370979.1 symmetrical bis(5'-nucleosyl)-tetraphosphatase [Gammaproteobacteria bacterium]